MNNQQRFYVRLFVEKCFQGGLDETNYKWRDGYALHKHVINGEYFLISFYVILCLLKLNSFLEQIL